MAENTAAKEARKQQLLNLFIKSVFKQGANVNTVLTYLDIYILNWQIIL